MSKDKTPMSIVAFGKGGIDMCMGTVNVNGTETVPVLIIGFKVNDQVRFCGCLAPEAINLVESAIADFRKFVEVNYATPDDEIDPDDIKYISEENEEGG